MENSHLTDPRNKYYADKFPTRTEHPSITM